MPHLVWGRLFAVLTTVTALVGLGCEEREAPALPVATEYTRPADYALPEEAAETQPISFTDVTAAAGIEFVHESGAFGQKWMPETLGSGGGFFDYDGDGRPDLLLVNSCCWPGHEKPGEPPTLRLYRNVDGVRFEDVTQASGLDLTVYGMGCAFADYDADGDQDIYITAWGDNRLLRNDDGRFTDVTAEAGVTGNGGQPGDPPSWSTSAAWLDADRDGWLDLFVCNYVQWTPETDVFTTMDGTTKSYALPQQYPGQSCRLYRNLDGRRFEDVTASAGVLNDDGKSLGVAVADFNADGWPDIVVANDAQPNFLYFNRGDGTFEDVAMLAGVAYDEFGIARAGMGIDVADLAHDGKLSIAIGNFSREPLSLYTQLEDDVFQDTAGRWRLTKPTLLALTFGVLFVDLDLDGYADLVMGNGHVEPDINAVQQDVTFAQKPLIFRNEAGQRFIDLADQAGEPFAEPIVARGVAAADIDDDGDADLLLTVNGGSPRLLRNDYAGSAHWIKLRLVGAPPNRDALGATVTVHAGDLVQTCMVRTGSSYLSQSDTALLCGLGPHPQADRIDVRWPDGQTMTLGPTEADATHIINQTAAVADAGR